MPEEITTPAATTQTAADTMFAAPPAVPEVPPTPAPDAATTPKADGDKPADPAAPADGKGVVPETYTFKAPEGTTLDEKATALFTPVAKELGLTQENAQKLVDLQSTVLREQAKNQVIAWTEATKNDPEIGGAKFDETSRLAQVAFAKFGNEALKSFLEQSGLGNQPEMVRFFAKIGAASGEDKPTTTSPGVEPVRDAARTMFPDMK